MNDSREPQTLGSYPWEGLNAFFAVVRTGSLSGAAAALGSSQPTVGRRIDALEAVVGATLLERLPTGCRPTRLGRSMLPHLEQIRLAAGRLEGVLARERDDLHGVVRVACGPLLGQFIARHADALLAGASGLELEVLPSLSFVDLVEGGADIALRNRRPDDAASEGALIRRMGQSPFAVYAARRWVDARQARIDVIPAGSARWIGYRSGSSTPSAQWFRARFGREAPVRFGTSLAILEATRAAVGPSVLPTFVGDSEPSLVRLGEVLWDELCFDSWMVRPAATRGVRRVQTIADRLAAMLPRIQR